MTVWEVKSIAGMECSFYCNFCKNYCQRLKTERLTATTTVKRNFVSPFHRIFILNNPFFLQWVATVINCITIEKNILEGIFLTQIHTHRKQFFQGFSITVGYNYWYFNLKTKKFGDNCQWFEEIYYGFNRSQKDIDVVLQSGCKKYFEVSSENRKSI